MAKSNTAVRSGSTTALSIAIAFVGVAILFFAFSFMARAPEHQVLISLSASGIINASPDQASVFLYLNATGDNSAAAVSNLSTIASELNSSIMPYLNSNSSLIKTLSYSVYSPQKCINSTPYYYPPVLCVPQNASKYYVAAEYIQVTVPQVSNVNPVLGALSSIPGVSINNVGSDLSVQQEAALNQQALAMALDNATSQARILAGNKGIELQNITVENGYIYYPMRAGLSASSSGVPSKTFFPGTASVTKSIMAVFKVS